MWMVAQGNRAQLQKFEPVVEFLRPNSFCLQDWRWKQKAEATPGKAGQTSGWRIGEEKIKESVWQIHFSL